MERIPLHVKKEAQKSRLNPLTQKLKCLACFRQFIDYEALAQHLVAKHDGINAPQQQVGEESDDKSNSKFA